jgi:fructokinase
MIYPVKVKNVNIMIPKFNNKKVLCIGEVLWDNMPGGTKPGGALLNTAYHLHKNGIQVTLVSKVGTDTKGVTLLGHMKETGLNTDAIYFDDTLPTSEANIKIDRFNNIRYNIIEPVAWDNLKINMKIVDYAGTAGAIIYGSLASRQKVTRETIDVILGFDNVKIMDVNLRPPFNIKEIVEPLLMKANIAKFEETEVDQVLNWHNKVIVNEKERLKWISEFYGFDIVCVKKEDNGAMAYSNDVFFEYSGREEEKVGNVGSGAAFLAGFVSSLMSGKSIQQALNSGCQAAAINAPDNSAMPYIDNVV